ncbi:hypothetical protein CFC21_061459 [Triticum aestivum]|uniref:Pectinesterase inhibitor domain-containing protein n=3 Tax=Triticinae TaxID=1648030 RepID=A0A3B6JG86_WHEAT|nr:hypothetical protein CFC21_061459 [Triticum aestivum]
MAARCRSTRTLSLSLLFLGVASLVNAGGSDVKAACTDTPYPEYCATVLSACPKSKSTDALALAEIAVRAAANTSAAAATLARFEKKGIKDGAWWCTDHCAADIEDAATHLSHHNIRLADVCCFITRTESDSVVWNCNECRRDGASKKNDLLSKDCDLEKIMGVLSVLIKRVRITKSITVPPVKAVAPSVY